MSGIVNGLFAARSGIAWHGFAIGVVGDNISNSSTVGYKSARTDFSDQLSGAQTPGRVVGIGSQVDNVVATQEQGTLEFTGRNLDLAIDGRGYFIVADGASRFYTRAGNFKVDPSGYIVTNDNNPVLGFPLNGTGALEPLNINNATGQNTIETTEVTVSGNLNAASEVTAGIPAGTTAAGAAPPVTETVTYADLNEAAQFSTVVQVFDSLGAQHNITMFFYKTGAGAWTVQAIAPSEDVDPSGTRVGFPRLLGSGTMTFGTSGQKTAPAVGTPDITITPPWNNNSDNAVSIDMTLVPFTQFSATSNILSLAQNGDGVGSVTGINIDKTGEVRAILNNGQETAIGTLGMASFASEESLVRVGGNLLQKTTESGEPVIGLPNSGNLGTISAGSLELSNVDLATEFIRLLSLQRGFQANSRIINSINDLLSEIIQIV